MRIVVKGQGHHNQATFMIFPITCIYKLGETSKSGFIINSRDSEHLKFSSDLENGV